MLDTCKSLGGLGKSVGEIERLQIGGGCRILVRAWVGRGSLWGK